MLSFYKKPVDFLKSVITQPRNSNRISTVFTISLSETKFLSKFRLLIFFFAALIMLQPVSAQDAWLPLGPSEINQASYNSVSNTSIAINGNGIPYIVFVDNGNDDKATVKKFENGTWSVVGSAGFSAGVAYKSSIAIDNNNIPYVVYGDGSNLNKATVQKFENGIWSVVGSAGFTSGQAGYTFLAINNNNTPYVVYTDGSNGYKATVQKFENGNWSVVGSSGFSAGGAAYTSIAIDNNNTPYVVYYDGVNGNKATVQKFENGTWSVAGNAGFSDGSAQYTSIAIDNDNKPYVVYRDFVNGYKATVQKFENGTWSVVGSSGFSVGEVSNTSIAIDNNNTPYVVYRDINNGNKATVQKFEDGTWSVAGNAGFSAGSASYTSIAIDNNNTPFVVYSDGSLNNYATVQKFENDSWSVAGIAGFSAGWINHTSIAIDNSNTPYVVYSDRSNYDKATVQKFEDETWSVVGGASFSTGVAYNTSIAIDNSNNPYVVYRDDFINRKITVQKFENETWSVVGNAGFSVAGTENTSIAIDNDNIPYVAYSDESNGYKSTVQKFENSTWSVVGSSGFSAGQTLYTSIAIDNNNIPYVVYYDAGNGGKVTVQKFENSTWSVVGSVGFSAGSASYTSIAIDNNNTPFVGYSDGSNGYKATVQKFENGTWSAVGSVGFSVGSAYNTSLAIDNNNKPYVVYKDNGNGSKATVQKFENGTWSVVGSAGFSVGAVNYTSIAIDNDNKPIVAFSNGGAWAYKFTSECEPTSSSLTITECNSYTAPDGAIYTTSGEKTAIVLNTEGCDETITINLTIINPVKNSTQNTFYCTIQSAIDDANSGDLILISDGIYNERVSIDKSITLQGDSETGTIISGSGLTGTGRGIFIGSGVESVSIKDLTIEDFAGNNANIDAGIYAAGGNNNLLVEHVTIQNNVGGSGFYANGPIDDVTLDYVTSSGHTTGARGIVIWNGFKSNITITNSTVFNNNCCGIELQDGDATGVTLTNNNVYDNGDNGIGLTGLAGPDQNLISNNTLLNNGRFGIEIKNPNGFTIVSGNTVSRTVPISDLRDIMGIGIIRRGVLNNNVDVPNEVVVSNNTVSGYTQSSTSDGFGIVIEGTKHTISGNTLTGNDVGLQQQAGHLPYPGDGDQANLNDDYFGRGNSPTTCENNITGNTYSSNGIDTRNVGFGGGLVTNTNTGNTYCSIQEAIDDPATLDGHTIEVAAGTYAENIVLNKELDVRGPNYGINPNTGTRVAEAIIIPATGDPYGELISVDASNISITGFTFDGDNPNLTSGFTSTTTADIDAGTAVAAYNSGTDNLKVNQNIMRNLNYVAVVLYPYYGTPGMPSSGNEVIDNLIEDIGTYDTNSGVEFYGMGILIHNNAYTKVHNNVLTNVRTGIQTGNFSQSSPDALFDHGIRNNTITTRRRGIFHNTFYASNPSAYPVEANTITGLLDGNETAWDGILISTMSVPAVVKDNIINIGTAVGPSEGIEVWNTPASNPVEISGGTITGVQTGIFLNNYEGYDANGPSGAHANIDGVEINAAVGLRLLDSPNSTTHGPIVATITGSLINANEGVVIEETAAGTVSATINGNSITGWSSSAINSSVDNNTNATCNWYGTTNGQTIDNGISGDVTYIPFLVDADIDNPSCLGNAPIANLTQGTFYMTVQAAVNAAVAADVLEIQVADFTEPSQVVIDKSLTVQGLGKAATTLRPAVNTGIGGDARGFILVNSGVSFSLQDLTIDGSGKLVWQAVRNLGEGTVDEVRFTQIKFNESGPQYAGVGIAAFGTGNVNVSNSDFDEIGRIGVQYFGTGITGSTFTGNTYTGKGAGDWLDYALDISAGAKLNVNDNSISGNRGVASSDGSTSAGVLVSTYYGGGTEADITGNSISNSTTGVFVGFDASDASLVNVNRNSLVGNDFAIGSSAATVDGTCNWYGTIDEQTIDDAIIGDVTYVPILPDGSENNSGATGFDAAAPCILTPYASFVITPSANIAAKCDEFTILVSVETTGSLNVAEAHLTFDPAELEVISIEAPGGGSLPISDLPITIVQPTFSNINGTLAYGAYATSPVPSSDFDFFQVTFRALGSSGSTSISHILTGAPKSIIAYTAFVGGVATSFNILDGAESATVTLGPDVTVPVAVCQDITLNLDAFGNATIAANDINNGSSDACGTVSLSIDKSVFDCSDVSPSAPNEIWINEFHYMNNGTDSGEFIEVVSNFDASGYKVVLYNGAASVRKVYATLTITSPPIGSDGIWNYYVLLHAGIQNGDPDGFALVGPNPTNTFIEFLSYGGSFKAMDGPAINETSVNVGVKENGSTLLGHSIQLVGTGSKASDFTWAAPSADSPGAVNAGQTIENVVVGTPVTLTVTDNSGNISTCISTVTVIDNIAPTAICKDFTVALDATGNSSFSVTDIDDGSFDACGIASWEVIHPPFTCADLGANNPITLTVTDNNGNSSTCSANVTVIDGMAPTAVCKDITAQLDPTGNVLITAAEINNGSSDNCGVTSLSVFPNSFTCTDIGSNTVTLTVSDASGNTATCTATVMVEDNVAPVAVCQNIDVYVDANGNASILAEDIDGGSTDNCGIASVSIDKTNFNCTDVGAEGSAPTFALVISGILDGALPGGKPKALELYVAQDISDLSIYGLGLAANGNGSISQGFALYGSASAGSYLYFSNEAPGFTGFFGFGPDFISSSVANFNGDDVIALFENGTVIDIFGELGVDGTGEPWEYSDGWAHRMDGVEPNAGAFNVANWSYSGKNVLKSYELTNASADTPFPIGMYSAGGASGTDVTLTVTDVNGNSSTCIALVTVLDIIVPDAVCHNITVQLDANGDAIITAADVDNGSTDNCSASPVLTLSQTAFDCSHKGQNPVTLTVEDASGNSSSCTAIVIVEDNVAPTAICQDITVQLNASGTVTITGADVDGGSTDNCGVASLSVSPDNFTCSDVGPNTVDLLITDINGNSAICTATVTVEDNIAPTIACASDGSRFVDQVNNTYKVQGTEFDATATDNCSVSTLTHNAASIANAVAGADNVSLNGWQLPVGVNTITFTVTDPSGHSATCDVVITVEANILSGTVTINLACTPTNMRVLLFDAGTPNLVGSFIAIIDVNGDFSISLIGVEPSNYDVFFKAERYLQQGYLSQNIGSSNVYALSVLIPGDIAGLPDIFNDNVINSLDLSLIIGYYNTQFGDPNFNERCDLNCNDQVDGLDLSLLIFFYLELGDNPSN